MKRTNESGYTLVSVLLIFLLFTILGVSLTTMSLSSVKASKTEQNNQSAFYIAEAGLNYKYHQIKEELVNNPIHTLDELQHLIDQMNIFNIISFDDENSLMELQVPGSHETFAETHIEPLPEINEYTFAITSTGHEKNQKRTVRQTFALNFDEEQGGGEYELPPFAVFTSGNQTISGGKITGNIATNSTESGSIEFKWGGEFFTGDIYVPDHAASDVVIKPSSMNGIPDPKTLDRKWNIPELPPFPMFPNLPIVEERSIDVQGNVTKEVILNSSRFYDEINISGGAELIFDLGNSDKEIVTNKLNLQEGKITLKGKGSLSLYITDKIDGTEAGSGSINLNGSVDQINIFLQGSDDPKNPKSFTLGGDLSINGSLYTEDANINLSASGGIKGNIFTGGSSFQINGGSTNTTQLFFAPKAHFKMSGGAKFEGMIIADSFDVSGHWDIVHK